MQVNSDTHVNNIYIYIDVKKLTKKKKSYAVHPHTYKKEKKKKKEISVEKSRIFYKTQKDNRKGGGRLLDNIGR